MHYLQRTGNDFYDALDSLKLDTRERPHMKHETILVKVGDTVEGKAVGDAAPFHHRTVWTSKRQRKASLSSLLISKVWILQLSAIKTRFLVHIAAAAETISVKGQYGDYTDEK